jgi:hypothetical protein
MRRFSPLGHPSSAIVQKSRQSGFAQHLTQQCQGTAKGGPSPSFIAFRPEKRGQFLTGMQAAFNDQVDEERQHLTSRKRKDLPSVPHVRRSKKRELEPTHFTTVSHLFHTLRLHYTQGNCKEL